MNMHRTKKGGMGNPSLIPTPSPQDLPHNFIILLSAAVAAFVFTPVDLRSRPEMFNVFAMHLTRRI